MAKTPAKKVGALSMAPNASAGPKPSSPSQRGKAFAIGMYAVIPAMIR